MIDSITKAIAEADAAIGIFIVTVIGGLIMWAKKQMIDNVYATKQELRQAEERLEHQLERHEVADVERYEELQKAHLELHKTIAANHDEMKTLIITQIVGRKE